MMQNASLMKRFAASLYELLSLVAIWLLCTFIFVWLVGPVDTGLERFFLQITLWLAAGAYFIVCWVTTGQTLAAQAWKIKLVNTDNHTLSVQQAVLRYMLATVSCMIVGLGFLWFLIDKEQFFLHDRLLKTRLTMVNND
ncbi:MAG: transporter [Methylophilaceae bacterium]|nr:MAG: transporter [Methylophilaceae bacterium]